MRGGENGGIERPKAVETRNPKTRLATPDDAPRVHALLIEAFADSLLPFTIYRAPQSVARLAALADEGSIRLIGDLDGVAVTSGDHLAYLAVAERARGRGMGRLLLERFHAGRAETTLDVLADNPARRLYERMGYAVQSESANVRLSLGAAAFAWRERASETFPPKNTGKPSDDWSMALHAERRDGFAALDHDGMRIGLLAGNALRLLDSGDRTVEACLDALARIGFAGREEMVLLGVDGPPKGYETIQAVRSLRMKRNG